jgi:antitoxin YefM
MVQMSYTELRQNLKRHMDEVCESRAPLVVRRQHGEAVVMLSLGEYESLQETLHLLRDSANARRLLHSINEAEAGNLAEHDLEE